MAARWESEELGIIIMLRLIQPPSSRYHVEVYFGYVSLENPRLDSKIQKRILRSLRSRKKRNIRFSILDSNLGFSSRNAPLVTI